MPAENENGTTTETTEAGQQTPAEGAEATTTETGQEPAAGETKLTHEAALAEVTKVRGEAANYRTKLRDAEEKLKSSKTVEEFEEATKSLTSEIAKLEHQILTQTVAQAHELPSELASLLKGDTKEELEAAAKLLQKHIAAPAPSGDLQGGLDPDNGGGDPDANLTPGELAKKYGPKRR